MRAATASPTSTSRTSSIITITTLPSETVGLKLGNHGCVTEVELGSKWFGRIIPFQSQMMEVNGIDIIPMTHEEIRSTMKTLQNQIKTCKISVPVVQPAPPPPSPTAEASTKNPNGGGTQRAGTDTNEEDSAAVAVAGTEDQTATSRSTIIEDGDNSPLVLRVNAGTDFTMVPVQGGTVKGTYLILGEGGGGGIGRITEKEWEFHKKTNKGGTQNFGYLKKCIDDSENYIWVGKLNDEVAAVFIYSYIYSGPRRSQRICGITVVSMWTKPTYRKWGLITLLMRKAIESVPDPETSLICSGSNLSLKGRLVFETSQGWQKTSRSHGQTDHNMFFNKISTVKDILDGNYTTMTTTTRTANEWVYNIPRKRKKIEL